VREFRFHRICLASLLWGSATFLSACALVDYIPPGQGTSVDLQISLAKSLEENMKKIPFDPAGKTVDLRVVTFGCFRCASGPEGYVQSLFQEWIIVKGGHITPGGEFQMSVYLPAFGNVTTRRDLSYQLIPLFYSERFRTTARLAVLVRDAQGKVVSLWQGGEGDDLEDIYLIRMLGPLGVPVQPQ